MALNSLQSNFSVVDAIRKSGQGMNKLAIPEMIEWCRKLGYEVRNPAIITITLCDVVFDQYVYLDS